MKRGVIGIALVLFVGFFLSGTKPEKGRMTWKPLHIYRSWMKGVVNRSIPRAYPLNRPLLKKLAHTRERRANQCKPLVFRGDIRSRSRIGLSGDTHHQYGSAHQPRVGEAGSVPL